MKRLKLLLVTLIFGCTGVLYPLAAGAVLTLTYDDTLKDIQQTDNSPCVIGSPSCNNPDGFKYTAVPGGPGDQDLRNSVHGEDGKVGGKVDDSFTYTVGQITTLIGSQTMNLLIDVNQSCGTAEDCPISLELVNVYVDGVLEFQLLPVPQDVPLSGSLQGNGYSDAGITGLDFTSFDPSLSVDFHIVWTGQSDGQESFFLAGVATDPGCQVNCFPEVPEPSALMLMGAGLILIPAVVKRVSRRRS